MLAMLLRKIKYRGVAMVEYAVLLAFICIVAGSYLDDGGIEKGIEGCITKVLNVFDREASKPNLLTNIVMRDGVWDGNGSAKYYEGDFSNYCMRLGNENNEMYYLEPNSSYTYTIDIDKLTAGTDIQADGLRMVLMLHNNADGSNKAYFDSNRIYFGGSQTSINADGKTTPYSGYSIPITRDGNKISFTINTPDKSLYLGSNLVRTGSPNQNTDRNYTAAEKTAIQANVNNALTLVKN